VIGLQATAIKLAGQAEARANPLPADGARGNSRLSSRQGLVEPAQRHVAFCSRYRDCSHAVSSQARRVAVSLGSANAALPDDDCRAASNRSKSGRFHVQQPFAHGAGDAGRAANRSVETSCSIQKRK
jgi:hypothetical protein